MDFDNSEKPHQLLFAASDGDAAAVRSLLEPGLKADTTVSNGRTPLMEAAGEGKARMAGRYSDGRITSFG
jgi:ankyrin repeat protein